MRILVVILLLFNLAIAKKLALVMGNSHYSKDYLRNPINDAVLIKNVLESVGFSVTLERDIENKTDMEDIINRFARRVGSSDIVAIYYSGHGMQYGGRDYLIPTQVNIAKKAQIPSVTVSVDFLLGGVSDAKLSIVMLDACRNNPYRSFVKGVAKGLGQVTNSMLWL